MDSTLKGLHHGIISLEVTDEYFFYIKRNAHAPQANVEEGGLCNNFVYHTSWVAVVTPTDRPKSVCNRCLIELFCDVVCVVTLPF